MKHVSDVIDNIPKTNQVGDHDLQGNIGEGVRSVVDDLFRQLPLIFPAWHVTWKTAEEIKAVKKEWVKALYENGINSTGKIKLGLRKARAADSAFIPSPGTFVSWCTPTPEDMGWPSEYSILQKCIDYRVNKKLFKPRDNYTRPLVIEMCKRVDWFAFEKMTGDKADKFFSTAYKELLKSGYREPQETDAQRLPTRETVDAGMSDKQKGDEKERSGKVARSMKDLLLRDSTPEDLAESERIRRERYGK